MSYCFLNFLPSTDDRRREPDCPKGYGCILLADLQEIPWGIFDVPDDEFWTPDNPVSDDLACLIESAMRYPPALGLGRDELSQVFDDHRPSQTELAGAYGTALRTHLSLQHEAPYVMAPALTDDAGYLTKGQWYWVLKISGNPPSALWVSDDFRIYESDMDDFDLTGQQLRRLGRAG